MSVCQWCKQEMTSPSTVSCTDNGLIEYPDGEVRHALAMPPDEGRCHDCGIQPLGYHHPGCDMELCPQCKGQLISCGCLDDWGDELTVSIEAGGGTE